MGMNILIVHNYYQIPGGEDTVVANEKKLLEDYGHKVILYSRDNSELNQMSFFRKLALPITTVFNPRTYMDIRGIIKKQKVEIVHVHNMLNLISPSVYYAALSRAVPVIQTIHNFRMLCPGATFYRDGHICEDCVEKGLRCAVKHGCYRESRFQTLACVISMKLHRMTGIYKKLNYICLTEFNKEKLLKLKQIKEDRVYVKPNFTFNIVEEKEVGGFYLYIGRMEEIKGVPLLIEAFSRMPDKKLVLAGIGEEFQSYREAVAGQGLENIEFKGFLEKRELGRLLTFAKAVIVVSQCYEAFGMIIVEAFASHTPVIVGDVGNVGDLVEDGVDGLKFIYDSPDALVEAVEQFERLDITALGENAYQKYKERFSPNSNYESVKAVYEDVSGGDREAGLLIPCIKADNKERAKRYVFVGRIERQKGIEVLLQAWKQVESMQGESTPELVVCGMGPMEGWCRDYIEENGLKTVKMRGFVPHEEIGKLLGESRALILPTQCYEGFPMTILEAYSVGMPVLGSDIGNTGSLIKDGVTGLRFKHDDIKSIIDAVNWINNNNECRDISDYYKRHYSKEINYEIMMKIYSEISEKKD